MTPIAFYIMLHNVTLKIPAIWETKHCTRQDIDEDGERLAAKLGGTLLYFIEENI